LEVNIQIQKNEIVYLGLFLVIKGHIHSGIISEKCTSKLPRQCRAGLWDLSTGHCRDDSQGYLLKPSEGEEVHRTMITAHVRGWDFPEQECLMMDLIWEVLP
jgi:hypothetical protein